MIRNQKGFSLVELMAVLVLTSVILVPLLISFTNSIVENQKAQSSRLAASVAEGALYSFEKIDFAEYRAALDSAQAGGADYLELNVDNCATNFSNPSDITICEEIFNMISSNLSFDATTFKVYIFDYSLTTAEHNGLVTDGSIEESARDEINTNQDILDARDGADNQNLIWFVLWLDYYDNPDQYLVATGIIANDDL